MAKAGGIFNGIWFFFGLIIGAFNAKNAAKRERKRVNNLEKKYAEIEKDGQLVDVDLSIGVRFDNHSKPKK